MNKPPFEIRLSPIAGLGAFAVRRIGKGARIIEYLGERITQTEADHRYEGDKTQHPKVLLFSVDETTVIDAGVGGNEARFINHSCEPNCQATTRSGHVHIRALRDISVGEELTYDYNLTCDGEEEDELAQRYACNCGTQSCRGTMLASK